MKTIKIFLGIISLNLTIISIIQLELWPQKIYSNNKIKSNLNYGLVPLNEDGSINVNISDNLSVYIKGWEGEKYGTGYLYPFKINYDGKVTNSLPIVSY